MENNLPSVEGEIWKDIPGYEGKYAASSFGRIKNVVSGRIRKPSTHKDGYKLIVLHNNAVKVGFSVSRIIGKLFVPNPDNLPEINHIDLDKANNFYKNLEWTDRFGNMQHAFANREIRRKGTVTDKHVTIMAKFRKPVFAYNEETNETLTFESNKACAAFFGVTRSTVASTIIYGNRLRGKYKLLREPDYQSLKTQSPEQRIIEGL